MRAGFQNETSPPSAPGRRLAGADGPPATQYDVDIMILALNRTEETVAAIRSALGQIGVSKHLFVLDQGSRAASLDCLVAELHGRTDATLLVAAANLGVAGGRNLLSGLGHGRAIVALDNDAEFATADTAARLVAALDAEPTLAAVGCRIVTHDDGHDDLSSWGYPISLMPCAGECFDTVTYVGAGHAVRRSAWAQAGGYDAALFFAWEEFDFCLRAIALGWRVRYRGDIVIRHKVSGEHRYNWSADRWFYFVRNRLYIERKFGRRWLEITPRAAGYLVKGLRNGLLPQTVRGLLAANRMASVAPFRQPLRTMPPAGAQYLVRNDKAHRGWLPGRLLREVFGRLGQSKNAAAASNR